MFRIFLVILMFFHVKSYFTQHPGSIEDYIPYEYSSYSTHPILKLKTILHIVYRTKDDPNNIMANNHRFIDQQFTWINNSYKNLKQHFCQIIKKCITFQMLEFDFDWILLLFTMTQLLGIESITELQ